MFDSLSANISLFIVAAALIWKAGSALSFCVNAISEKTGMGKAFAGILFLGGATSLPELTTSVTAAASGLPGLAGSNLLGGIAMQIVLLAFIDAFAARGKALTSMAPNSALLIQGVSLIVLNALAIAAMSSDGLGEFNGVGVWSLILGASYLGTLKMVHVYEEHPSWRPISKKKLPHDISDKNGPQKTALVDRGLKFLWARFSVSALFVFAGGFLATRSAEAIIIAGGLDQSIVGASFMAVATSLPEATTTWAAVKGGSYSMAIASILGTNALGIALLVPADIFYRTGPILREFPDKFIFLSALGIILAGVYLWGILERKDRTFLNMGMDSVLALILYALGMGVYATL